MSVMFSSREGKCSGRCSVSITLDATEYTFQGEGITASFYPKGAGGLIIEGKTETFFVYQDHHLSKTFGQAEVDIQQIDNVGALVSGFKTKSVTTIQAATLVQRLVFPALQTHKVEHLDGTASVHERPLVAADS